MIRGLEDLVSAQADRRPDAVAVLTGDARLTYGDLVFESLRLAAALRELGCRRGSRVCLFLPKSPWAIIALLAVLEAGGVYVPVDVRSPAARLARIVTACDPAVIVAADPAARVLGEVLAAVPRGGGAPVVWLDRHLSSSAPFTPALTLDHLMSFSATRAEHPRRSSDPAHILFTSGSTGEPKGVVVTHDSALRFVQWGVRHFGIGAGERLSGSSPLHFDLSTFDVFGAFAAGAELHPVPPELHILPHKLAAFLRERRLTQWFSVPSALSHMARADALAQGDFPELRRVIWCGEVLPTPVLQRWMRRVPHARYTNLYGPTEATIASSYHDVAGCPDDARAPVPIGRPCDGESLLVLDENLDPLPPGKVGDLYIAGVGLSPGYWRDPGKSSEAFFLRMSNDGIAQRVYRTGDLARVGEDGLVYFVGRSDTQIKHLGHRVELGEIESALHAVQGLAEHAVIAVSTAGFEGTVICCAFVPVEGAEVTPASLRAELARLLPSYMLPLRWLVLPALPRNANGKIDRAAIKALFEAHVARAA